MEKTETDAALKVLEGQRERTNYYRGLLKTERKINDLLRKGLHDSELINERLRRELEELRSERA